MITENQNTMNIKEIQKQASKIHDIFIESLQNEINIFLDSDRQISINDINSILSMLYTNSPYQSLLNKIHIHNFRMITSHGNNNIIKLNQFTSITMDLSHNQYDFTESIHAIKFPKNFFLKELMENQNSIVIEIGRNTKELNIKVFLSHISPFKFAIKCASKVQLVRAHIAVDPKIHTNLLEYLIPLMHPAGSINIEKATQINRSIHKIHMPELQITILPHHDKETQYIDTQILTRTSLKKFILELHDHGLGENGRKVNIRISSILQLFKGSEIKKISIVEENIGNDYDLFEELIKRSRIQFILKIRQIYDGNYYINELYAHEINYKDSFSLLVHTREYTTLADLPEEIDPHDFQKRQAQPYRTLENRPKIEEEINYEEDSDELESSMESFENSSQSQDKDDSDSENDAPIKKCKTQ